MANDQLEVQNLSAAAKKPTTFVMSLWPGMIVALLSLKSEIDVLRFFQHMSDAVLMILLKVEDQRVKEVSKVIS